MADLGERPSPTVSTGEWRRRPFLSWGLRALIFAVPIGFSFGVALMLSRTLPRAHSAWTAALWISIAAIGSLLALLGFERAARKLLPLAALLNVSLLFPTRRQRDSRSHGEPVPPANCTNGWKRRARPARSIVRRIWRRSSSSF
jgi:hypothetical protein